MKRTLLAVVAAAVLLGTGVPVATAQPDVRMEEVSNEKATAKDWAEFFEALGAVQATLTRAQAMVHHVAGWRYKHCQFQSLNRPIWTDKEERLTAACVSEKWQPPGGLSQVMAVGSCESGWNRMAYNPYGPYVGIFQQHGPSWASRLNTWEPAHWKLSDDWRNSRSMITVSVRMAHADGDWGQWAGCA